MTARALLFTPQGALRAPWRIIGFLAATAACAIVASVVVSPFVSAVGSSSLPGVTDWVVILSSVAGGTALAVRWIDRRPWSFVWMDRDAANPRRIAEGGILGVLAIGLPSLALIGVGWLSIKEFTPGSWSASALRVSALLLVAALAEELFFRGYLFAVLREVLGWWPTLVLTSVAFGFAHVSNPGASPRALLTVTMAGFFLGGIVIATRSLYAAWLAHFTWNWTMAVLLHVPVSGLETETPDYRTIDSGPDWATGGAWGPEGGGGAVVGMLAGLGYLAARYRRRAIGR